MPFGLTTAPLVFTKIVKPVLASLRAKKLMSVVYLDDFLLFGKTFSECETNVRITISVLEKLGFIINREKSQLVPSQNCIFLGFSMIAQK